MTEPTGNSLRELKELLCSLAKRLTKGPTEKYVGCRKIKSSSDGLQITAFINIEKFASVYPKDQIQVVMDQLARDFSSDLGVYFDFDSDGDPKNICLSRFVAEGGPWIDEPARGIRFIYEVGKPIMGQIDGDTSKGP